MARSEVLFVIVALHDEDACKIIRPGKPRDMNKTGTTRVTVKAGEPRPRGDTDWARLDAMTDEEVVASAMSDPDAQPLGPEQLGEDAAGIACEGVAAATSR